MVSVVADTVIVELEARMARFQADIRRTMQDFTSSQRSMRREVADTEAQIRRSSESIGSALRTSAAAIAASFSIAAIIRMADGYTRFTNQLRVAGLEGSNLAAVQNTLFAQAQRYGVELESLGQLYGRLSQGARELGASQGQLLQFTNGVAAAIKVQGGDATAARGALLQLTQALGGQIVRAEEFNSINEGARPILQAVASGIDRYAGSVSRLRQDVIQGRVTSAEFFQGFLRGSDALIAQAERANLTIGQSFTVLQNALTRYIGQTNEAHSFSTRLSQAIVLLANNIDTVAAALGVIAVVLASRVVAGLVAATGATFAFQAVMAGAATVMEGASFAAATLGSRLLAVFGGPIGLAITAITLAIAFFGNTTEEARLDVERFSREGEDLTAHLTQLAVAARNAGGAIAQTGSQAATATGQVRAFAGAVGDAANRLYQLAFARARDLAVSLAVDRVRADQQVTEAQARIDARRTQQEREGRLFGPRPDEVSADALDRQALATAQARRQAAQGGYDSVLAQTRGNGRGSGMTFLQGFLSPEDRGERNVAQQLADAEQNLTIARRTGNRTAIQAAEAAAFEARTYQRYRRQGFTPQAAETATQADVARFGAATGQGNSARAARSGAAAARAQAARAAAAERDSAGDAARFQRMEREANNDIAQSRQELTNSAQERVAIEIARLDNERQNRDEELRQQFRQGQLGAGEEGQRRLIALQRLNNERYSLQKQVVLARETERIRQETQEVEAGRLSNARDLETAVGDLAETRQEHRASALRLLELSEREERLQLEGIIASAQSTEAQKQIARERLQILSSLQAARRQGVERQYDSPLQAYLRTIRTTGKNLNDSFEAVAVSGLEKLNDGLVDAITGAKSLGQVFHDVANQIIRDLLRIAIQQLIIKPLAEILNGGSGDSGGGGKGGGGILGILGGLFGGGGGGKGFAPGGGEGNWWDIFGNIPMGKAMGGNVAAGSVFPVGENGVELFKPATAGSIIPNNRIATSIGPSGGGGAAGDMFNFNVVAPGANAQTVALIKQTLLESAPSLVEASRRAVIRSIGRRKINR